MKKLLGIVLLSSTLIGATTQTQAAENQTSVDLTFVPSTSEGQYSIQHVPESQEAEIELNLDGKYSTTLNFVTEGESAEAGQIKVLDMGTTPWTVTATADITSVDGVTIESFKLDDYEFNQTGANNVVFTKDDVEADGNYYTKDFNSMSVEFSDPNHLLTAENTLELVLNYEMGITTTLK